MFPAEVPMQPQPISPTLSLPPCPSEVAGNAFPTTREDEPWFLSFLSKCGIEHDHPGHPVEVGIITLGLLYYPYLILVQVVARLVDSSKGYGFKSEYAGNIALLFLLTFLAVLISIWFSSTPGRRCLKRLTLLVMFLEIVIAGFDR